MSIIGKYIFGSDREIQFMQEVTEEYQNKQGLPNYTNQNMNITLPIYSIHGNHDYPAADEGNISTLDLFNTS